MLKRLFLIPAIGLALSVAAAAQSSNSNRGASTNTRAQKTTASKTTAQKTTPAATEQEETTTNTPATGAASRTRRAAAGQTRAQRATAAADAATTRAVREAFDTLIDGIRKANVDTVMSVYWNSPQLVLFNNNGTVTRTWDQVKSNRQSLYAKVEDVKLDVRDVRVQVLGRDAAVVTCLWTQSQTTDGKPETASGRLTLVFQQIGGDWKAMHAHTSPDRPDPSRLFPSERTTEPAPSTKPTPTRP
jgi:ketosteroid isomerase-like protein